MKTISDIKDELIKLDDSTKYFSSSVTLEAFELFKDIPEIDKLTRDLENMRNGEYSINEYGELEYSIEVPSEIADLPFINDYLTRDYGHLTGKKDNDLRLAQSMGGFISVNHEHDKGEYFVYDHDSNKPIIETRKDWMDNRYVAAVIEFYQHETGCFNDVIEICSRYGSYEKHFNTFKELNIDVDHFTEIDSKDLLKIIESYNQGENDEN